MLHVFYVVFVALTTIVLLWFGEAIVWLSLMIRRKSIEWRRNPAAMPEKRFGQRNSDSV
jgi:hypothetical protein